MSQEVPERAAPQDELVDTLVHCIVDLRHFPSELRDRIASLLQDLRDTPVLAGLGAERVQRELAPALTWAAVVEDVTEERWERLLARRRALVLHSAARKALGAVAHWVSPQSPTRAAGRGETEQRIPDPTLPESSAPQSSAPQTSAPPGGHTRGGDHDGRKHVRGSGLLLSGRGLSAGFKFLAELLIVRYLATSEYGSWTYGLSAVVFLKGMAALGLHRAVARFLPLHLERAEREDFVALLAFVIGGLATTSLGVVLAFHAFPETVARVAGGAPGQSLDLLFILIFLVPVDALDDLLTNVCAAFGNSRTIFVRRYVLSPGLRVGVALLLVVLQADARLLAYGYLFSGLAGLCYYAGSVFAEARQRGMLITRPSARLTLPVRKVLSFTMPVMVADVCTILMITTSPLLLGYFAGMNEVALFQVVVPVVALSNIVAQSFGLLFEPAAARLQARGDHDGLDRLYWRSAAWVAVLSFPAFVIPFANAAPMSVFLFGDRYAAAAPILSLLAFGSFVDAGLGFNNATLRVLGKVRWLLGANALGAALNVALNLALIPEFGALGAAIATSAALVTSALVKQVAMRVATGVRVFDPAYASVYLSMAATVAFLIAVRIAWPSHWLLLGATSVSGTLVVLYHARRELAIHETFPELGRWPVLSRLIG